MSKDRPPTGYKNLAPATALGIANTAVAIVGGFRFRNCNDVINSER